MVARSFLALAILTLIHQITVDCAAPENNEYVSTVALNSGSGYRFFPDQYWSANPTEKPTPGVPYRLDGSVVPVSYDLSLRPHLDAAKNFSFDGVVVIRAEVLRRTRNVTLHVHDLLTVHTGSIVVRNEFDDGRVLKVLGARATKEGNDFFVISLGSTLVPGQKISISAAFTGHLLEDAKGFYRSWYKENGKIKWMAVSDVDVTFARKVFPCFDEPSYKAVFRITLIIPQGFIARSNAGVYGEPVRSGTKLKYVFKPTPKISTYLVAFLVADFSATTSESDSRVKIWSRPETESQRGFMSRLLPEVLGYLEEYTNMTYSMDKLDAVAALEVIPSAMENWGMITAKEELLLIDEAQSPESYVRHASGVMSHEFAHQWFGNVVTPVWWTYAWLSEGFASFFKFVAIDAVKPNWEQDAMFLVQDVQFVLSIDSSPNSWSLTIKDQDVQTTDQAGWAFNSITYTKGSSFLRMVEHALGRSTFRRGVQRYLVNRKYSVVTEDDLFDALAAEITTPTGCLDKNSLKDVLKTWTRNPGYPLLSVKRNYERNTATITQRRFLSSGEPTSSPEWIVPLNWVTMHEDSSRTTALACLNKSNTFEIGDIPEDSWLLVNNKGTGLYRVDYDEENWARIIRQLNTDHKVIDVLNQAKIVDDVFALARVRGNYTTALELTRYFRNQTENVPWTALFNSLTFLRDRLISSEYNKDFRTYVLNLIEHLYQRYGSFHVAKETPSQEKLLINSILSWACRLGRQGCSRNAVRAFEKAARTPIPPDTRSIVYCESVISGQNDVWYQLWSRFQNTVVESERKLLMKALSCSRDAKTLRWFMDQAEDPYSGIRRLEAVSAVAGVCDNPTAFDVALEYAREKIQNGKGKLGLMKTILLELAIKVSNRNQAERLLAVARLINLDEAIGKTISSILDWMSRNEDEVGLWFRRNK